MRKTIFKKILTVLDQIELQGVTLHDTPLRVYEELVNDYAGYKLSQVKEGVDFLYEKQVLKEGKSCTNHLCEKQSKFLSRGPFFNGNLYSGSCSI